MFSNRTQNKIIRENTCRRNSCRWPLVEFFNLIDIAVLNAYALMKDDNLSRCDFIIRLVQQLCHNFSLERARKRPELLITYLKYGIIDENEFNRLNGSFQEYNFTRMNEYLSFPEKMNIQPSETKMNGKVACIFHESSRVSCHVCKTIQKKEVERSKNGCCFCMKSSCPSHSALICVDCLNNFIQLHNEKIKK